MILMFDLFETLVNNSSIDFNRGLRPLWEKYYQDKCTFEDIKKYGEELFVLFQKYHSEGLEFPFVRDELPMYAQRYGGEVITMDASEEADFLMLCNDMVPVPGIAELLAGCEEEGIPMYVLSNSGFTADALWTALDRMGIGQYFTHVWSSADYGRIKPDRGFYEQAVEVILQENPEQSREDILFVGDMYKTDVLGAHGAGLRVAWINRKGERDTEHFATYEIAETKDLRNIILRKGVKKNMELQYKTLREIPEMKDAAALWFHEKWGVPKEAYLECMDAYLSGETEYGWYVCMDGDKFVGGLGVIENDFHDRKDLAPNVCAVYTDEEYRNRGIAGKLLDMVVEDQRAHGISPVYLVTDHNGFYERYGWEFLCMAQGDGEPEPTKVYIHR